MTKSGAPPACSLSGSAPDSVMTPPVRPAEPDSLMAARDLHAALNASARRARGPTTEEEAEEREEWCAPSKRGETELSCFFRAPVPPRPARARRGCRARRTVLTNGARGAGGRSLCASLCGERDSRRSFEAPAPAHTPGRCSRALLPHAPAPTARPAGSTKTQWWCVPARVCQHTLSSPRLTPHVSCLGASLAAPRRVHPPTLQRRSRARRRRRRWLRRGHSGASALLSPRRSLHGGESLGPRTARAGLPLQALLLPASGAGGRSAVGWGAR